MAAKVYLIQKKHLPKLETLLGNILPRVKHEKWAVKLHMGEYGNLNYIRPPIAGAVVKSLKNKNIEPFLFDSTTLYKGSRYTQKNYQKTARVNGYTQDTVGCPIIISNEGKKVRNKLLGEIFVAKPLTEAKGLIVLSHFKGHPDAGFGGAIKNLGMGSVTRVTKSAIHTLSQPKLDLAKCIGCGKCVKVCPNKAITIEGKKSHFNYDNCFGCGSCMVVCPQKALSPKVAKMRHLLTEAASCVIKQFSKTKILYINVLMDIANHCDCFADSGEAVCHNIGILVSQDIVAIEQASLDLVNKTSNGRFGKLYLIDGKDQIEYAKKIGLGNDKYKLEII